MTRSHVWHIFSWGALLAQLVEYQTLDVMDNVVLFKVYGVAYKVQKCVFATF